MATFKKGDIVQLKSGGPPMTAGSTFSNGKIVVQWFAGAKMESAQVDPESIQPYAPPPAKP